jgi:hypothetical protein
VLEILGIRCPEADNDNDLYNALTELSVKVGVVFDEDEELLCMSKPDGGYEPYLPVRDVTHFIKAASLPDEIESRLSRWFTALVDERELSEPWIVPSFVAIVPDTCPDIVY